MLFRSPIIIRDDPEEMESKFILSLSINEMVLVEKEEREEYYRVRKLDGSNQRIFLLHHTFAGKIDENNKTSNVEISLTPNHYYYRKVTVDRIGRVRRAND